jgi:hypothetical protein
MFRRSVLVTLVLPWVCLLTSGPASAQQQADDLGARLHRLEQRVAELEKLVQRLPRQGAAATEEGLATVEGTVALNGQALTDSTVTFHLKDGQFIGGRIRDGRFRVDRVPVGTVKVTVESKTLRLPARYASEDASGLTVEVKGGVNKVELNLIAGR